MFFKIVFPEAKIDAGINASDEFFEPLTFTTAEKSFTSRNYKFIHQNFLIMKNVFTKLSIIICFERNLRYPAYQAVKMNLIFYLSDKLSLELIYKFANSIFAVNFPKNYTEK